MLDHVRALDQRVEELSGMLREVGIEPGEAKLPDLESCSLARAEARRTGS
jgi:hypothetical protein